MTLSSRLLLLSALGGLAWLWLADDSIEHGPGVVAPGSPRQGDTTAAPFEYRGYRLQPLADLELQARVLGRERYSLDREAELAPLDLALGWGPMSDESVLAHIDISQGGRWYRWSARELPIPRREIERHSANMHIIPANDDIADLLGDLPIGSVVTLRGQLVEARAADGWRWRSSLTRDDTGARSCELLYVERARLSPPP